MDFFFPFNNKYYVFKCHSNSGQDFDASKIPAEFSDSVSFQSEHWHILVIGFLFSFKACGLLNRSQSLNIKQAARLLAVGKFICVI